MASEEQVLEAVIALVDAALPSRTEVHEAGDVPDRKPPEFVTVYVVRRGGGTGRAGRRATRGWAAYLMGASSESGHNARNSLQKASDALENKVLVVGDERSTPMTFDNGRAVTEDKGWHSGVSVYHFTI
jgi:hypothetical protein